MERWNLTQSVHRLEVRRGASREVIIVVIFYILSLSLSVRRSVCRTVRPSVCQLSSISLNLILKQTSALEASVI